MSFTVTRQKRWDDGVNLVEITQGGLDYVNPDMLVPKYRNEGETTASLCEAVENAIEIAESWQEDSKEEIFIACGNTHGMTAHLDEMELNEENYKILKEQAEKIDDSLPQCDRCGKIIDAKKHIIHTELSDERFCSEYCADKAYENYMDELEEEEEE